MVISVPSVLILLALICFIAAAFKFCTDSDRWSWVAGGLMFATLSFFVTITFK